MEFTLIDVNRAKLKTIFQKHAGTDGKVSLVDFQKFCKNARLLNELIMQADIRNLFTRAANNQVLSRAKINYEQFECIIKEIAISRFEKAGNSCDCVKMLFQHILHAVKNTYNIALSMNDQSKIIKPSEISIRQVKSLVIEKRDNGIIEQKEIKPPKIDGIIIPPIFAERETNGSLDTSIREALEALKKKENLHSNSQSPVRKENAPAKIIRKHSRTVSQKSTFEVKKVIKPTMSAIQSPKGGNKPNFKLNLSSITPSQAPLTTSRLRKNASYISKDVDELFDDQRDLKEFLETEKRVQKEVLCVTVSLKSETDPNASNPFELAKEANGIITKLNEEVLAQKQSQSIPPKHSKLGEGAPLTNILFKAKHPKCLNSQLTENEEDLRTRSSPIDHKAKLQEIKSSLESFKIRHTQKLSKISNSKPSLTLIREYQEFLLNQKKRSFTTQFVMRMILNSWKKETEISKLAKRKRK
ncbi:unnamed protein product [Blepharisma stoltei]|uniref:EF-hand domain-containing protein n=1 Tax=Blepharisma stoltei TaxID=1481888 RepID=A0AAU9IRM5_9CILI|nr:unnamed protein product [Blepharisma stoltei]